MAHKPLVGGTAYEIGGGKDLIGGTVYEKDHGKTLVGGTVYEVGFAKPMVVVTLKCEYWWDDYVTKSIRYTTPDGASGNVSFQQYSEEEYEFPIGTIIQIELERYDDSVEMEIYLNDERVAYSEIYCSYKHTLTTNTVIEGSADYNRGRIYITET